MLIFRLLGWAWMAMLVVLTIIFDDGANAAVTLSALALATG